MKKRVQSASLRSLSSSEENTTFAEIERLIAYAHEKAIQHVNTTLIQLYWNIGEIISRKIEAAE